MKANIIENKSYIFAIEIVNLYKAMIKRRNEFVMSKQILKCGTSIGANVAEAVAVIKTGIYCKIANCLQGST